MVANNLILNKRSSPLVSHTLFETKEVLRRFPATFRRLPEMYESVPRIV